MKLVFVLVFFAFLAPVQGDGVCSIIQTAFLEAAEQQKEEEACRCFMNSQASTTNNYGNLRVRRDTTILDAPNQWIGCTRQKMPSLFRALNALNETIVSKLWIWDSLMSIVPNDIFTQVRPRTLIIEKSAVSVFRTGTFAPLGQRLRVLQLRGNIIKKIEADIMRPLSKLTNLDLSLNKIETIEAGDLDALVDLRTLALNGNSITKIEDRSFANLKNLRVLNLADNALTNITRYTFSGLDNLEHLHLDGNQLTHVDWSAFAHMKQLKLLDLGTNQLTSVQLRGLDNLERLFVNNNSIQSLKNVSLRDLSKLVLLSLDRNSLTSINDDDFQSLSSSAELRSLSLAYNKIKHISSRAFESLHQLETLSLQNNYITSLSHGESSVFRPLTRLKNLFLSSNMLTTVEEKTFAGLTALEILALDNNVLTSFHRLALAGTHHLSRLYLNDNKLKTLENNTLQYIEAIAYIIDLSNNQWECTCNLQWLAKWVEVNVERMINLEKTTCLDSRTLPQMLNSKCDPSNGANSIDEHSIWINVLGIVLGIVSVLIIAAIVVMYLQDGSRTLQKAAATRAAALAKAAVSPTKTAPPPRSYDLRRVPSDMVTLIPRCPVSTTDKKRVRFDVVS